MLDRHSRSDHGSGSRADRLVLALHARCVCTGPLLELYKEEVLHFEARVTSSLVLNSLVEQGCPLFWCMVAVAECLFKPSTTPGKG